MPFMLMNINLGSGTCAHQLTFATCTPTSSGRTYKKPFTFWWLFFFDHFNGCDDLTTEENNYLKWLFVVIDRSTFDRAKSELHFLYVLYHVDMSLRELLMTFVATHVVSRAKSGNLQAK